MMSLESIKALAHDLALRACLEGAEPYQPRNVEEVKNWKRCPAPNLGNYRPEGWRLVDETTVDKGWGAPGLDFAELKDWCAGILAADSTAGFAITAEGQWNLTLGYFTQDDDVTSVVADSWGEQLNEDDIQSCENCGAYFDGDPTTCPECDARLWYDAVSDDHYGRNGAYRTGKDEQESGKRRSDNPYDKGTGAHAKWDEGWVEMFQDTYGEDAELPQAFTDPEGEPLFPLEPYTE